MPDESDNSKQMNDATSPTSRPEQEPVERNVEDVSKLREMLISEEGSREKPAGETIPEKTELNQLPDPDNRNAFPPPSLKDETGPKPSAGSSKSQRMPTTSSLASRLWGLQELPAYQNESSLPATEIAPVSDGTSLTEAGDGNMEASILGRDKSQPDEKDTKPLHLNDDQVFDRINRTTGAPHPPQENRVEGSKKPEVQTEKDSEEDNRFTFFTQRENESDPGASGQPVVGANSPALLPSGDPYSSVDAGKTASEGKVPVEEKQFNIEQFLAAAKSEAQSDSLEAHPEEQEHTWPGDSLDDIRSIALGQPMGKIDSGTFPTSRPPNRPAASRRRKFPERLGAWWASLPTFSKILLGLVVLLILLIAVSVILIIYISGAQKTFIAPSQLILRFIEFQSLYQSHVAFLYRTL